MMNPGNFHDYGDGNHPPDHAGACQLQSLILAWTRTTHYGLVLVLLHAEYMTVRWGRYGWDLLVPHQSAVVGASILVTFIPLFVDVYGYQYYGRCGIKVGDSTGVYMLLTGTLLQIGCFIIIVASIVKMFRHLREQVDMVAKPAYGVCLHPHRAIVPAISTLPTIAQAFYGEAGIATAAFNVMVEATIVGQSLEGGDDPCYDPAHNVPYFLFPLNSLSDAFFGVAALIVFILPERASIMVKFGFVPSWAKNIGKLRVDPAIDDKTCDKWASYDEEFNQLLAEHDGGI